MRFLSQFFSSSVLRKVFLFLSVPLYLNYLAPAQYGIFSLCMSFSALLAAIMACGMRNVVSIEYFYVVPSARWQFVTIILITLSCLMVLTGIAITLFSSAINSYFFGMSVTNDIIFLCFLYAVVQVFIDLFIQLLLCAQRTLTSIGVQLIASLITIFGAFLVLHYNQSISALLCVNIVSMGIPLIIGMIMYFRRRAPNAIIFPGCISKAQHYFVMGFPFVPLLLSGWLMAATNRTVLAWYGMFQEVGLYAVAELVALVFHAFILAPLSEIYYPSLFAQFAQRPSEHEHIDYRNKKNIIVSAVGGCVMSVFGYYFLQPLALWILPSAYHAAIPFMLLMFFSQLCALVAASMLCYIQYKKKTWFIVGAFMSAVCVNAVMSYYIIPIAGLVGGMCSLIASYAWYMIIAWRYNVRLHALCGQHTRMSTQTPL